MAYSTQDDLFPILREPRSFWEKTGLTPRQQRVLDVGLVALVILFIGGWTYSAIAAWGWGGGPDIARRLAVAPTPMSPDAAPPAAFLLEAAMQPLIDWDEIRGASGEVQVVLHELGDTLTLPDAIPEEVAVAYAQEALGPDALAPSSVVEQPARPGIWNLVLQARGTARQVPNLRVITLVPTTQMRSGRIGAYRIGDWPQRGGIYAAPRGFVEVTQENMNTHVSRHFRLRDFLTKGQEGVWPKYVVISPRLLDKLELTIQELEAAGHPVENVFVVSGFRTPWYNAHGGTTSGRGALSRHMYGDAADIAIDNTRNGCMDDLNGDGRVDVQDARIVAQAAERVERRYPHLVGGIGIYRPTGGHCGMVHIDTRGSRARW